MRTVPRGYIIQINRLLLDAAQAKSSDAPLVAKVGSLLMLILGNMLKVGRFGLLPEG